MDKIRSVLIGYGWMGRQYAALIHSGAIEGMILYGICCRNKEWQKDISIKYPNIKIYDSEDVLFFDSDSFDALIIVTPHKTHIPIASKAVSFNKHVLVDKPLGISTLEVKRLLLQVKDKNIRCGTIFNMRAYPAFQKAKEILNHDLLGTLHRVLWVANNWYRSPAYHKSSAWRSSWKGEGGGLLINQCQHTLDIWQWLLGMPESLYANIDYGKYNDFDVDDAFDIQFYYSNGLHGTLIASSGESPGVNRLEIWGSKGRLCIEDNTRITVRYNLVDTETFALENKEIYGIPAFKEEEVPACTDLTDSYRVLFQHFSDNLRKGTPLMATGEDALNVLELSNGAYLSSWLGVKIDVPINDYLFSDLLEEHINGD